MEWARFREYARRIQELRQRGTLDPPSPEVFLVIQLYTINKPLLPNLKTLVFREIGGWSIPFIPLLLSPRTTSVDLGFVPSLPASIAASMVTTLPTLCPNLQAIRLHSRPRDPTITATVSGTLLVTNRNTLQRLHVNFPFTEEASEVIYKLPNLRILSVVIERETSLPSASLPNQTDLTIKCDTEKDWPRLFHGATLGKLESVTSNLRSKRIGDFLGALERAALSSSSSVQNTLSKFSLFTSCSWDPNYSSLLPFTQLVDLDIQSSCDGECSSRVDDDVVINLSRAMPKLKFLKLGNEPCRQFTTGVTVKGLMALAHHCSSLSVLRIHFQVASLSVPPASPGMTPNTKSTAEQWTDCALTELQVGEIPVPEESVLMVALTLLRLFPRIETIDGTDEGWMRVENAICHSRGIIDRSSKQHLFTTP